MVNDILADCHAVEMTEIAMSGANWNLKMGFLPRLANLI